MGTRGSPQRYRVGAELRRVRENLGWSGERVADSLQWSQSKVSRIETGATAFTVRDVDRLLGLYGVDPDIRAELLAATADENGEGSWITSAGGWGRRQGAVAALESTTREIRQYQPVVVPGLLQTRAYAHAMAVAVGAGSPDYIVDVRMARQQALEGPDAPRFVVVVDARALLFRAFPVEVCRGQIQHLTGLVDHPNIELGVVPIGAQHAAVAAQGFTIFDFRSCLSPRTVWIESPGGDCYFSEEAAVARFEKTFTGLKSVALHGNHAVEYLNALDMEIERFDAIIPGVGGS
jgi:transcriptional regulator with XRE-family HTH domain